jgi:aspartokinase-like uncharacterized kinase
MSSEKAIFKIGGTLLENPIYLKNTFTQFLRLIQENRIKTIILIPGGGSYANFIREIDIRLNIGDTLAHWMAIFAMNYNGYIIKQQYSSITLTEEIEELKTADRTISLFLPFNYLKKNDFLPHSWDVTSDSITLYIAHKLGLKECFLIKDVDGIIDENGEVIQNLTSSLYFQLKKSGKLAKIDAQKNELKQSKPIDNYTLELIDNYNLSCILLNGAVKESRIFQYFSDINHSEKTYTKISFS